MWQPPHAHAHADTVDDILGWQVAISDAKHKETEPKKEMEIEKAEVQPPAQTVTARAQ